MNWENPKDNRTELFMLLGMVLILMGFVKLLGFSGEELIIGGAVILTIGVYRFFKKLGKKKNKFFRWKRK